MLNNECNPTQPPKTGVATVTGAVVGELGENIAGRKFAEDLLSLVNKELACMSPRSLKAFFEVFDGKREAFGLATPAQAAERDKPMSDLAAATWSHNATMPFWSKYADCVVSEVPLQYLIAISKLDDPFKLQVRRYLASPALAAKIQKLIAANQD